MSKPDRLIEFNAHEEFFWTLGSDGRLRFVGCSSCGRLHHPPLPRCPHCGGVELEPTAVSGRASVASYTINRQPFLPGFDPPYIIGLVEIDEDPTIRLTTNIVACCVDDLRIGLDVEVLFEQSNDLYVPIFRPRTRTSSPKSPELS